MKQLSSQATASIGLATAAIAAGLFALPAHAAVPLMNDFIGLNVHSGGSNVFQPRTNPISYSPVASVVRDYHPLNWDISASNTSANTTFPMTNNGVSWGLEYGDDVSHGFKIDVDVQFEMISASSFGNHMAADAYKYGQEFAKYFGTNATYGGTGLANTVEIGNEPGSVSGYSDAQFATMFQNMAQGIRSIDPNLPIVTCNLNTGPSGSYSKSVDLFKTNNLTSLVDVYATHTYAFIPGQGQQRSYPEDTRLTYLTDVQNLINWRNANDPTKKVWVTEFGYDASTKTATGFYDVTDTQQAQYNVRSYLIFARMGVDRAYAYYFNDDDAPSLHASSGLTRNWVAKPSYWGIAHMKSTLGGYKFSSVIQETVGSLYVYAFTSGSDPNSVIWAMWSPTGSGRTTPVTLSNLPGTPTLAEQMPLTSGAAPVVSFTQPGANQVSLTVGESPVYLHMTIVPEPTALTLLGLSGFGMLLRRRRAH